MSCPVLAIGVYLTLASEYSLQLGIEDLCDGRLLKYGNPCNGLALGSLRQALAHAPGPAEYSLAYNKEVGVEDFLDDS